MTLMGGGDRKRHDWLEATQEARYLATVAACFPQSVAGLGMTWNLGFFGRWGEAMYVNPVSQACLCSNLSSEEGNV